jgi:hypothetical protein
LNIGALLYDPAARSRASRRAIVGGLPAYRVCPQAGANCRLFAPGWWCDDRELVVFPDLLRDADDEANGDDEPDDDYG